MQKALPSRAAGHGPSAAICGLLNTNQRAIALCVCVWFGWGRVGAQRAVPPARIQALSRASQSRLPKGLQLVFEVHMSLSLCVSPVFVQCLTRLLHGDTDS